MTRVEYIQNTSNAYIDTGFKPNKNSRIVVTAQTVTHNNGRIFGAGRWNSLQTVNVNYEGSNDSVNVSFFGNAGWTNCANAKDDFQKHILDFNKNVFYFDGVEVSNPGYTGGQCKVNLALFGCTEDDGTFTPLDSECYKGKIFGCKIYDNDVLVRDFVPAINEDDVAGMLDTVNDVFFSSPNGSTFIAGEPIFCAKPSKIEISKDGGEKEFTVICSDFTITEYPDWVTLDKLSGVENDTVKVTAPLYVSRRKGTISCVDEIKLVSATEKSFDITADCTWSASTNSDWFDFEYDENKIYVTPKQKYEEEKQGTITIYTTGYRYGTVKEINVMYTLNLYSINLNEQWEDSGEQIEGCIVYKSMKANDNETRDCYINIEGYYTFTIQARSDGENNYDYLIVYDLDSETVAKYNFVGQQSETVYTPVTFENIDGGSHSIKLRYRKDASLSLFTDSAYFYIKEE